MMATWTHSVPVATNFHHGKIILEVLNFLYRVQSISKCFKTCKQILNLSKFVQSNPNIAVGDVKSWEIGPFTKCSIISILSEHPGFLLTVDYMPWLWKIRLQYQVKLRKNQVLGNSLNLFMKYQNWITNSNKISIDQLGAKNHASIVLYYSF